MSKEKHKKIPTISSDRLDTTIINYTVGYGKDEKIAHAFVKGNEKVQALTVRIPLGLYQDLREYAFKNKIKINQLIVELVKKHIQT